MRVHPALSFFLAFAAIAPAVAQGAKSPSEVSPEIQLQAELEQVQSESNHVQGFAIASMTDGRLNTAATGTASPAGEDMMANTPVRIASITKTFVAAAILRLSEEGRIELDQPINSLISQEHDELLRADGYETDVITVRHLLMHAGGLDDHFGADNFREIVLAQPDKVWTRSEQLSLMTDVSNPVGQPGEQFHYSDTGYLLLGEIIERTTGQSLSDAVRHLNRFDALQLDSMRWEGEQTTDAVPARAHQWLGGIDTNLIHGSVDAFGGGGLIGSVDDIARYFDALFNGRIFAEPETLDLMLSAPMHPENSPYRIGVFTREIDGFTVYSHGGFWGLEAVHVPALGLSVAGVALDQSGLPPLRQLIENIVRAAALDPDM